MDFISHSGGENCLDDIWSLHHGGTQCLCWYRYFWWAVSTGLMSYTRLPELNPQDVYTLRLHGDPLHQGVSLATGHVTQPPSDGPAMYVSDN